MGNAYENQEDQVEVILVAGGAFLGVARTPMADIVVAFDNAQEIALLPDHPNLIKVALGARDTVLSLLERLIQAKPEFQSLLDEYRQRPNVHLRAGLAQDFRIGIAAIEALDFQGELEPIFEAILTRMLEAVNGSLDSALILVTEMSSNAGGCGSGVAPLVGRRFCDYAARYTQAKIKHRKLRLGALTYIPLSWYTIENTIHMTKQNLEAITGSQSVRELCEMEVFELPLRSQAGLPIRDNRAVRTQLATTLAQARYSNIVNANKNLREVNQVPKNHYGALLRGRAKWSAPLDTALLRRAAATSFRQQLKALRQNPGPPDMNIAERIEVELSARDADLPSIDDLMARIRQPQGAHDPTLDDLIETPPRRFDTTVWVYTTQAQSISLEELLETSDRPKSLEDFRRRCQSLQGLLHQLRQTRDKMEKNEADQARRLTQQRQVVRQVTARLRSFWHAIDKLISSSSKHALKLKAAWQAYLSAHDQCSQTTARYQALAAAHTHVAQVLDTYLEQWTTRIEKGLEAIVGPSVMHTPNVVFKPLEAVYSALLDATLRATAYHDAGKHDQAMATLELILLDAISHITRYALADMLECSPEYGAIVTALAQDSSFAYRAPMWGGVSTHDTPRYQYIVLPPTDPGDLAKLQQAADDQKFMSSIGSSESCRAGVCIVALDFFAVKKREDVLPPLYAESRDRVARNGSVPLVEVPI